MRRLALQRCVDCRAAQYPPLEICARCLSDRLTWDAANDWPGQVIARTVLHNSFELRFRPRLPIAIGLVRFDAGPVAVCFIGAGISPGERVKIRERVDEAGALVLEAS
jgi:uncharacterized OB-fold protein